MAGSRIIIDAKTNVGRRKNNEDKELSVKIGSNTYLLAVADGMGGGVAGEVASLTVIEELERSVRSDISDETTSEDLKEILTRAYKRVQLKVQEKIEEEPELAGMGTTLTTLLVHNKEYVWGNIGDSRLYMLKPGKVSLLTKDHSHIQEMLDRGENPSMDYIRKHSNLITRCISNAMVEADIYPNKLDSEGELLKYEKLEPETALFLCSDGLITLKPEDEIDASIEELYFSGKILDQVFDDLIQYAKDEGSRDNITIAALEYGSFKRTKASVSLIPEPGLKEVGNFEPNEKEQRRKKFNRRLAILIPTLLLLVAIAGGLFYMGRTKADLGTEMESEKPCEWQDPISSVRTLSRKVNKMKMGSYSCEEDFEKILLIRCNQTGEPIDTITDTTNNGSILIKPFIEQNHFDTMYVRIEIMLKNDSMINRNPSKIILR